jgi:hypothetical protein
MNDDELRLLIRAAIESAFARETSGELRRDAAAGSTPAMPMSFGQYRIERAAGDTTCIIEPAVQCNHCGFCKCHGH